VKKILIVSRNYPPLWGGMERLNLRMVEALARVAETRLIAPEGAVVHAPPNVAVTQVPLRPVSRFLLSASWQTLRLARAWKPGIILAGSGLMAPPALAAARLCGARAVAYAHGLDITVPHPVYRTLWWPALRRLDAVITNSRATAKLAQDIGLSTQRISIVPPGVDLPPRDAAARERFRATHDLGNCPVLLSVGRLAARKGLREFVADALPQIVSKIPSVRFVIVGTPPSGALYAKAQTPEHIRQAAETVGVAGHLRFLGNIGDSELLDAYAGSDAHVFPVRHIPDDPEGFGMVAVEAAASGLATVAYATGGVVDAVHDGVSGVLVPPGDATAFADAVVSLLRHPLPDSPIRDFAAGFGWNLFGEKIHAILERVAPDRDDA
jgi:phosphatidylinositol alpha-1,6-mannosyltransferase